MQPAPAGRCPARRAVAFESASGPKRKATSTPSPISACRWSFIKSTTRSLGWVWRKPLSLGITTWTEKLEEAATPDEATQFSRSACRVVGVFEDGESRFHTREVLGARLGQYERARTAREERRADFLFEGGDDA